MDEDLKKSVVKTGTSIVGIVCKDGIVMASDRRATLGGHIVSDKDIRKTEKINDYLLVSIAGGASDAKVNSRVIGAQLKLKELKDKKRPTIKECANYIGMMKFQNIRRPSMIPSIVGNLVAGINENGSAEIYNITPDGLVKGIKDYDADGSGMIYIWGLLERQYKKSLTVEEGIKLAIEAIKASSARDTASGNGVDVYTVTKEGIKKVASQKVNYLYEEEKE